MASEAEEEDIPEEIHVPEREMVDIPAKRRRSRSRIKRWSCLKCDNCLAEDCGQCINWIPDSSLPDNSLPDNSLRTIRSRTIRSPDNSLPGQFVPYMYC